MSDSDNKLNGPVKKVKYVSINNNSSDKDTKPKKIIKQNKTNQKVNNTGTTSTPLDYLDKNEIKQMFLDLFYLSYPFSVLLVHL